MKTIKTTYLLLTCIFFAWLLLSWLEIISKNILDGATYNDYNIIVNFINYYMNITGGIF